MPDTPLNTDALTSNAELFKVASTHHFQGIECLCGFKSARSRDRTEHIMLHTLAVAQPVVTSVESIPAQVQVISWEEEPEHECWKLAPDETFVGLIVKSDRVWSPADKYMLNIERPEVNDV